MENGTDIAKAYVQIIPSADGIKGKLQSIMDGEAGSAGKSAGGKFASVFGTVAKAGLAAVGAAAAGIAALAKTAVSSYAEFEQLQGGAELLFGDAYGYIAEQAANAYATVQMSQNEYLQQVNGFAVGLKTALGGNEQAAAELANRIVTAEADVVAATGNTQEAVQNAFNGIMKGNFTMLDNLQLGITPTKAGFQEMIDKVNEWNAANGRATNYQIDNLADCQAALVDYIDMQGLAGYAAGEAADTIQGSLAATKAAWSNLLTGLATDGADFDTLISGLVTSASGLFENLMPRVQMAIAGFGQLISSLAPVISAALPQLVQQVLPGLLQAGTDLLTGVLQGLLVAAPQLATAAVDVIGQLAGFLLENLPLIIQTGISVLVSLIQGLSEALPQLIAYLPEVIVAVSTTILDNLPLIIQAGIQLLVSVLTGVVQATPRLVGYIPTIISSLVRALIAGVGQMLSAGAQLLSNVVSGIRNGISSVVSIGRNIVEGIWNGISNGLGWIKSKITGWVGDVTSFLKNLFGIGSPSKLMRDEVGIFLAQGVGVGFEAGMKDVTAMMQDAMPDLGELVGDTDIPLTVSASGSRSGYAFGSQGAAPVVNYGGVTITISGRDKDAATLARELQIELQRRAPAWA